VSADDYHASLLAICRRTLRRKNVKKMVSLRLSDRDNEALTKLAERLQMSKAEVVSRALELYAEKHKND